jgi:nucleoside-diphosphate-sugar epimerase
MRQKQTNLLTGATGLLGQYLLRDLLLMGHPVAVLARDSRKVSAAERIGALVDSWSQTLGRKLPVPIVLAGDLVLDRLGLTGADRNWLTRHCQAIVHAAGNLSFQETLEGEPWRTNFEGTQSLLSLCREAGVLEWHHVSTAFVWGEKAGLITEDNPANNVSFHNPYEKSKLAAERLVRAAPGMRATIYRPAVIVGDGRTGFTSNYNGLYRFLELGVRLAKMNSGGDRTSLPLRLPLSGEETWNLVPVDWVSRAIIEIQANPGRHGRTYNLVSRSPVTTRLIRDVAAAVLDISGVEFSGANGIENPSPAEQMFVDGIQEYWPYLGGNPSFTSVNTDAALPDLPPPAVDRPMLERLIRFAADQRWGKTARKTSAANPKSGPQTHCAHYIEKVFPKQARQSNLGRQAGLDITIGIDLKGPGGGQWSCQWRQGELIYVHEGLKDGAAVVYHTDTAAFQDVLSGAQTPQEAFFEERITIKGDLETALKLAVLFGQFLAENPVPREQHTEVVIPVSSPL